MARFLVSKIGPATGVTPVRGWVGVKLAEMGGFFVQSGRFLAVQKFIYFQI